ncbi:hypothetical protein CTAYLR_002299 [Chrysophaeum taylorii]|uniref:START domain-containing protein n=1 Tax=Chrysophaeum taylorii TaxID=2483200 RepID=A0AAD7UPM8_9STRA|nr:hypothetical protein CTAYLR_002299 [Chrysophaeum taylorii]
MVNSNLGAMSLVEQAKVEYERERMLEVHRLLEDVDPETTCDPVWVERAKREAGDAAKLYAVLREGGGVTSSEEWRLAVDSGGIAVRSRPEATARFASVCVSLDLAASLSLVMTVVNEVSLLPSWMPEFLGFEARCIKQVSRFRQLVWIRVKLPFPFAPRDVVFDAMGVDVLDRPEPCILIVVRTPDPKDWPDVEIDAPKDRRDGRAVRARVLVAGAFVKPKSSTSSAFCNVVNIDPHLDFLPGWLFNWVNRRLVWYAFDAFRGKVAAVQEAGLSPEYQEFVAKKSNIYDEMHRRLRPWEGGACVRGGGNCNGARHPTTL